MACRSNPRGNFTCGRSRRATDFENPEPGFERERVDRTSQPIGQTVRHGWLEEDSPPFSIYSELGGLPQDPCCGGESSLEAKKGAGGGVQSAGSVYRRREALRIQVTSGLPQLSRTNSSRRQTLQPATTYA